ncbi:alpha-L-rhamnosidase C-terminal domain-containing protein [Arthrobacter sp. 24S4-2]|uniref:alpha-L-rhamnosidase C-terminal domain-containing protein n=1 Tax=Arthrobacter sp. 24S4-2 TaxID=2575374 RepID=UPI0020C80BA7|nr:alpha-L-rhamnosidase C-terminal domain-containing protein [Arthrobacter sp. 24S4-2]
MVHFGGPGNPRTPARHPGYRRRRGSVHRAAGCRLDHARGSVPLQRGVVSADWHRGAAGMELGCTVPAGVRAEVVLPAGRYTVKGPTPGVAVVATAEAVTFRIHPGTWHFRPE